MLFNLLLVRETFYCAFPFYFVLFLTIFTNPIEIENARLKFVFAFPTGVLITVVNDATQILPVVTDETINDLSKQSKE